MSKSSFFSASSDAAHSSRIRVAHVRQARREEVAGHDDPSLSAGDDDVAGRVAAAEIADLDLAVAAESVICVLSVTFGGVGFSSFCDA